MASTGTKASHWLANYYLRGLFAVVAAVITLALGGGSGLPLLVGIVVWVGLWLASKVREGYAGSDRNP